MASVPTAAFLSHPNGGDTADAWIHPDLLTPVNHMRRTVFRRESDVFDRDQVHAMRRRIYEGDECQMSGYWENLWPFSGQLMTPLTPNAPPQPRHRSPTCPPARYPGARHAP